MRVHQPGHHLSQQRGAKVDDWSWGQTARRLGVLVQLARQYKGRTALAIVSLLAATALSLAPPFLAKLAIDQGIEQEDLHRLGEIVVIDHGRIAARGTAEELDATSPVYREIADHGLVQARVMTEREEAATA